jgi:hypothetical protein
VRLYVGMERSWPNGTHFNAGVAHREIRKGSLQNHSAVPARSEVSPAGLAEGSGGLMPRGLGVHDTFADLRQLGIRILFLSQRLLKKAGCRLET